MSRENFLIALVNRITKDYKALLAFTRGTKPFKIIEIIFLSTVPGETRFLIQITNKNSILKLSAAEIFILSYDLNDFYEFHAEMIIKAAQGKLVDFLSISNKEKIYKIISKKYDKDTSQYVFVIEIKDQQMIVRTSNEIAQDKELLFNMDIHDIFDIGYTQGSESVLKEKKALLISKSKNKS